MLQQEIEQQFGRLGGFAGAGLGITENLYGRGQAAATGQAASGMTSASNIANLLANQGQAIAGGQVAGGNVGRQTFSEILGAATVASKFSDRRLKKNIKQIGTRADGLNVYEFNYIWGGKRQVGLMAQEVQSIYPSAVSESNGFLMVDYSKV